MALKSREIAKPGKKGKDNIFSDLSNWDEALFLAFLNFSLFSFFPRLQYGYF